VWVTMDKQIARISNSSSMLIKVNAALAKANTLPEIVENGCSESKNGTSKIGVTYDFCTKDYASTVCGDRDQ